MAFRKILFQHKNVIFVRLSFYLGIQKIKNIIRINLLSNFYKIVFLESQKAYTTFKKSL